MNQDFTLTLQKSYGFIFKLRLFVMDFMGFIFFIKFLCNVRVYSINNDLQFLAVEDKAMVAGNCGVIAEFLKKHLLMICDIQVTGYIKGLKGLF